MNRKYSDGMIWGNSIDIDDNEEGNDGGYDKRGNYIVVDAMKEIVQGRRSLAHFSKRIAELEHENAGLLDTIAEGYEASKGTEIKRLEAEVERLNFEVGRAAEYIDSIYDRFNVTNNSDECYVMADSLRGGKINETTPKT